MNDYSKPQDDKAHQDDRAQELIKQLNRLEAVDRRVTPEHVARRFRELLGDIEDAAQAASGEDISAESITARLHSGSGDQLADLNFAGLNAVMEVVVAAVRGAAADIIADAEQKAQASRAELQRAQDTVVAAGREAEQIVTTAREEANEALEQAAKMVREAGKQAARIVTDARREAEKIIKSARQEQPAKALSVQPQDQLGTLHARNANQLTESGLPTAAGIAVLDENALAVNDLESTLRNNAEWSRRIFDESYDPQSMFEEIYDFLAAARAEKPPRIEKSPPAGRSSPTGGWSADRAVIELYALHYRSLVRLAALLVRDTPTAEEVVQDSFVAMHGGWQRLRDAEKALAYLRQAVVNRSRSVLRHRTVVDKNMQKAPPDMPSEKHGALAMLERSAVISALHDLPDRQRQAIVLRYYADLSEAEIATTMGISRSTVKSHTARGMAALRDALELEPE